MVAQKPAGSVNPLLSLRHAPAVFAPEWLLLWATDGVLIASNTASGTITDNRGVRRRNNRIETSGDRPRKISAMILLQAS
jgi:hypothetical protein